MYMFILMAERLEKHLYQKGSRFHLDGIELELMYPEQKSLTNQAYLHQTIEMSTLQKVEHKKSHLNF